MIIEELIKISNHLDSIGKFKEADTLDKIILEASDNVKVYTESLQEGCGRIYSTKAELDFDVVRSLGVWSASLAASFGFRYAKGKLYPLTKASKVDGALRRGLIELIKITNSSPDALKTRFLSFLSTISVQAVSAAVKPGAAGLFLAAGEILILSFAAMTGVMLGTFIDSIVRIDYDEFDNAILAEAAYASGYWSQESHWGNYDFDKDNIEGIYEAAFKDTFNHVQQTYTSPSINDINGTGFKGLTPWTAGQLSCVLIKIETALRSHNISESSSEYIIKQYLFYCESNIINRKSFQDYVDANRDAVNESMEKGMEITSKALRESAERLLVEYPDVDNKSKSQGVDNQSKSQDVDNKLKYQDVDTDPFRGS